MQAAERRDPGFWQYTYGAAVAQGAGGKDPRATARRALTENPLSPYIRDLVRGTRPNRPGAWRRAAARAPIPFE
jgi:hypothetical protein